MRITILALVILFSPTVLVAQQTTEWYRVYTFDDSIIEMNTQQVALNAFADLTGSIGFRWSFNSPQSLSREPQTKYKARLEVFEFDCSDQRRYRPVEMAFLDTAGKVIRIERIKSNDDWRSLSSSVMMEKLYYPACELIKLRSHPPSISDEAVEIEKAEKFAHLFSKHMEKEKDFAPLVKEFFAPDYLGGYLRDKETNQFLILNSDVAAKVSHAELQRYYVALLNVGYLGSLYFINQSTSATGEESEPVPDEKLIPPGIFSLVNNHPYTSAYKGTRSNYDYLAENIDSPARLKLYTDLLEKIAAIFRKKLTGIKAETSEEYFTTFDDIEDDFLHARIWTCGKECFGLPAGTKLFQVNVPVFRLQLAEFKGEMKIVSLTPYFQ